MPIARRASITLTHVVWSAVAFGVVMLLLAATPNLALAFPAGMLMGGEHRVHDRVDRDRANPRRPRNAGRVLALQAMVFVGSTPIGGPVVGAIC